MSKRWLQELMDVRTRISSRLLGGLRPVMSRRWLQELMGVRTRISPKVLGGLLVVLLIGSIAVFVGPSVFGPSVDGPSADEHLLAGLLAQAEDALRTGDARRAESLLRKLLKEHPDAPEADTATYRLGDAMFQRDDLSPSVRYTKAIDAYREGLRLRPDSPLAEWALLQMGEGQRFLGKFHRADALYRRLEREYPEGHFLGRALYGRAKAHYALGDYTVAQELFARFTDGYPKDELLIKAMLGLGNSLYQLKQYQKAAEVYREVQNHPFLDPTDPSQKDPDLLYTVAETCFRAKDYPCAKTGFTRFYNLYPRRERSDEALTRLGDTHAEMDQPKVALALYLEVLSLFPQSDGAAISMIRLADLSLKHPSIVDILRRDIEDFSPKEAYQSVATSKVSKPLTELALYKRGKLLSREGHHLAAVTEFRRLLRTFPRGNLSEHSRASAVEALDREMKQLLAENRNLELLGQYYTNQDLILGTDLRPSELFCRVGRAYLKVGMPHRGIKVLRKVVKSEFQTACYEEASWLFGRALLEAGDLSQASDHIKQFLARYPDGQYSRRARFDLAKALFLSKSYTEAMGPLEAETGRQERASFSYEALWMLARARRATDQPERAIQAYRTLVSLGPKAGEEQQRWVGQASYELGDLLFEVGTLDKALKAYRDAIDRYPNDPRRLRGQFQMGRALQRLGRPKKAKRAYRALVKTGAESVWTKLAAEYLEDVEGKERLQAVLVR